jgi:hypothetical protein
MAGRFKVRCCGRLLACCYLLPKPRYHGDLTLTTLHHAVHSLHVCSWYQYRNACSSDKQPHTTSTVCDATHMP